MGFELWTDLWYLPPQKDFQTIRTIKDIVHIQCKYMRYDHWCTCILSVEIFLEKKGFVSIGHSLFSERIPLCNLYIFSSSADPNEYYWPSRKKGSVHLYSTTSCVIDLTIISFQQDKEKRAEKKDVHLQQTHICSTAQKYLPRYML